MPPLTRNDAIDSLANQVASHMFNHLFRNRPTGPVGRGWAGGLRIYSTNNQNAPDPAGHFNWLDGILNQVATAATAVAQVDVANQVLIWGGMRLRFANGVPASRQALADVIRSANIGGQQNRAAMNSSLTKVAAVFGYQNGQNTVWDSRVSTAVCFRLACLFSANGDTADMARTQFPGFGYIPGRSRRVIARTPFLATFWPNVYGTWPGHFAGAQVMLEIADNLNQANVVCPQFGQGSGAGNWTPWKVNMVFFMDDITECPQARAGSQASCAIAPKEAKPAPACTSQSIASSNREIWLEEGPRTYIKIVDRCKGDNLGMICTAHGHIWLKNNRASSRYLIGEISTAGGDFTTEPGYAAAPKGVPNCGVGGANYQGGVRFGSPTFAISYLKNFFTVCGCLGNGTWADQMIRQVT